MTGNNYIDTSVFTPVIIATPLQFSNQTIAVGNCIYIQTYIHTESVNTISILLLLLVSSSSSSIVRGVI